MILNNSQSIQSGSPLSSSISKRVANTAVPSSSAISPSGTTDEAAKAEQRTVEQTQNQANQQMISQLQSRDRVVRSHEAAHVSAGGSLVVSGPSYTYQNGPDGRSYAIGSEVQLDVSPVANDPEATLKKSEQIRRAALAPADPSPQDLRVSSSASQLASRARVDIAVQRREEAQLEEQKTQLEAEKSAEEAKDQAAASDDSSPATNNTSALFESNSSSPSQITPAISAFTETTKSSMPGLTAKESQVNQFV